MTDELYKRLFENMTRQSSEEEVQKIRQELKDGYLEFSRVMSAKYPKYEGVIEIQGSRARNLCTGKDETSFWLTSEKYHSNDHLKYDELRNGRMEGVVERLIALIDEDSD